MNKVENFLSSRTVVFTRGEKVVYESTDRGVKPLIAAIDSGVDYSGCDAADKIVGKAAANLYLLINVKSVRACVMTYAAKDILTANGIQCEADTFTDKIVNRNGDGPCPMETAVADADSPDAAFKSIREKIKLMQAKTNADKK